MLPSVDVSSAIWWCASNANTATDISANQNAARAARAAGSTQRINAAHVPPAANPSKVTVTTR